MARRKKKRDAFKLFLYALFCVGLIWVGAFVVWLYWKEIRGLAPFNSGKSATAESQGKGGQEKISDEDRKKLGDILNQRR